MDFFRKLFICGALMCATQMLTASYCYADRTNLSQGWRFHKGEVAGAEGQNFDDSSWQRVSVPHDWSIADHSDGTPPFDPLAISGADSGYLPGGVGWYRREFDLDPKTAAGVVLLEFEAVYMDADVWVNGKMMLTHHYGYTAFNIDLTDKVRAGRNVIVVKVNHADPSSRWYAGSGIIRPVHIETLSRAYIDPNGSQITTPIATDKLGAVKLKASVINTTNVSISGNLKSKIVDADGKVVAETVTKTVVSGTATENIYDEMQIISPKLWSVDTPYLYSLDQVLVIDGQIVDERRTRFGVRALSVDAQNGLKLNGKKIVLKGGNIHHDNYLIGAAGVPDADRRKVALMKSAGYNAIRNAHNPASQATLDAADELGMLVIDEAFDAWSLPKKAKDYSQFFKSDWQSDIESLVVSGRNHPSVVFWSIGNEIPEQGTPKGVQTAHLLAGLVHMRDPSRPVTEAVNLDSPANAAQFAELDVAGYNYRPNFFASDHLDFPKRVMYSSESTSKDAFKYWQPVEGMPWVIGDFVWTAVDYLGETGIGWMGYNNDYSKLGPYPWHLAYCGEIDATGRKRAAAYYREVLWKTGLEPISAFVSQPAGTEDLPDRNMFTISDPGHLDWSLEDVHPSWTWPGQEGKALDVNIYSEFPEVELFLNGKSLGRKQTSAATEYKTVYSVPYAPGKLTAVGYRDGRPAGRWELATAGAATQVKLTTDRQQLRADGQSLIYIVAELLDADGVPIYARDADRHLRFEVAGEGELAGAGNGNPRDPESLQSGRLTTFHGRAVAAVRSKLTPGSIKVSVSVDGLPMQVVGVESLSEK